jgi:hypothetical protein
MSLLGSLLPSILSVIRPDNIVRGIVNTASGVLGNLISGKPEEIGGSISRGLRTLTGLNDPQSVIGSIGGQNGLEPSVNAKLSGEQNAANVMNIKRMDDMQEALSRSAANNVANNRGVYSEDTTRSQLAGPPSKNLQPFLPKSENGEISRTTETAPGGFPGGRQSYVHIPSIPQNISGLKGPRDAHGYRPSDVPKFNVIKKKKKRAR